MGLSRGVPPLEAVMLGVELWLAGLPRSPDGLIEEGPNMFLESVGGFSW